MALYTTTRRILGSMPTPFRNQSKNTSRQDSMKGIRNIKCNAFVQTRRQPVIRFRKGNYRQISQSSQFSCLEGLGVYPKPFSAIRHQVVDDFQLNGRYIAPLSRHPGFPGMLEKPVNHKASFWRWCAQAKEPGSPAPSKGGKVATSGGGLGKLDSANEGGFFHKVNKSKLEQIKQMLREKTMGRKPDNPDQAEPK